jgi:SAM-dependent methyltransferase
VTGADPSPERASFSRVDSQESAPLVAMMDATDAWTAVGDARTWVLERSDHPTDLPVLDVGCGPGTFAAMARPSGRFAIDLDRSAAMVQTAVERHPGAPGVVADVLRLPFGDGAAGLVRCERVLQWTEDPGAALDELWRVTAPGGHLAVTDTDWGTFRVVVPGPGTAAPLAEAALGWVPHPRLATSLAERLAGLGGAQVDARVDRVTVVRWDPDDPSQRDGPPGLPLHSIAAGASAAGRGAAERVVDALADAARDGRFEASLDIVTVIARRRTERVADPG